MSHDTFSTITLDTTEGNDFLNEIDFRSLELSSKHAHEFILYQFFSLLNEF